VEQAPQTLLLLGGMILQKPTMATLTQTNAIVIVVQVFKRIVATAPIKLGHLPVSLAICLTG
jgi:hypothetical protein